MLRSRVGEFYKISSESLPKVSLPQKCKSLNALTRSKTKKAIEPEENEEEGEVVAKVLCEESVPRIGTDDSYKFLFSHNKQSFLKLQREAPDLQKFLTTLSPF
jgi:hypothetical protein